MAIFANAIVMICIHDVFMRGAVCMNTQSFYQVIKVNDIKLLSSLRSNSLITLSMSSVNCPVNETYQGHTIRTLHYTAKLLCLESINTGSLLNVMFRLTLCILFDNICASSTLKVVEYFTSAEKVRNFIAHSCPPYNCIIFIMHPIPLIYVES